MIRLVITDDDVLIRESLKLILDTFEDIEVVGKAANGKECLEIVNSCVVDVVLLDMRMPIMDGTEVLKRLKHQNTVKVLVLTTFDENDLISSALTNGAAGYILKNSKPEKIISAIRSVALGNGVFEADIVQRIHEGMEIEEANKLEIYDLSKREIDVIQLIAEGLCNKEISERLYISEGTVKNYITSILTKMNLKHRTQIAITYLK